MPKYDMNDIYLAEVESGLVFHRKIEWDVEQAEIRILLDNMKRKLNNTQTRFETEIVFRVSSVARQH